ncbi:MAG: glycosyltransferase family 2 protein [Acidimicrobiales bacterium]
MLRPAIVVCTRDRPVDLRRCLASVAGGRPGGCGLIVVDQSATDASADVVAEVSAELGGIDYIRSDRSGLSAARNQAAAAAEVELLLFTDDDCEIDSESVREWWRIFSADPSLGIGFGRVTTPPFDPAGVIPSFDPGPGTRAWDLRLFAHGAETVGMGANMVVRRQAWAAAGGFDELLGAGAAFPAAEELDLAFRLLRRGWRLAHAGGPLVMHHGYRAPAEASSLGKGYSAATAAMYAKHVRCGDARALLLMARETAHLVARVIRCVVRGARPLGLNSLLAFLAGIGRSAAHPVDRRRRLYRASSVPGRARPGQPVTHGWLSGASAGPGIRGSTLPVGRPVAGRG